MLRPLIRLLSSLWRPFGRRGGGVGGGGGDGVAGRAGLLWSRDLGRCAGGEFSMAVVQANRVLEDQSRIESGPFGTFVGVYDGHGGPDAARYVCDHLFAHFRVCQVNSCCLDAEISSGPQGVTCDGIQRAFLATEESFIALVSQLWNTRPDIATTGSCCLVGVVCQQTLYVANLGDSRVILGKKVGSTGEIAAISLSNEHNANVDAVRQELQAQHPNDPQIVILKHGVWRIKGIIQVSRSIGDAYMKHSQYNREPINPKFRIAEPMNMPILTANPSIMFHHLEQSDSFLIFASDGLWEHLSDQKAVEIVHSHPRAGSAKGLIKAALHEAARKREMRYSDLKRIDKKVRRHFHDDITVIIIFLNHEKVQDHMQVPQFSVRSALDH
uniref:protein-serine/threonine phosphatase n=1 Tax=Musa acuminata subsp. malaccensis TaxID=214687 RepID=A0A804HZ15_MUSAM|nr:PREDICTED: probable protein phosphatase 2C 42 isoform X2 [Musa acuminata subsp. malaccensis]